MEAMFKLFIKSMEKGVLSTCVLCVVSTCVLWALCVLCLQLMQFDFTYFFHIYFVLCCLTFFQGAWNVKVQ